LNTSQSLGQTELAPRYLSSWLFSVVKKTGNVVLHNIQAWWCNNFCSGKLVSITYLIAYLYLQISSMQCACAILLPLACRALLYFSTLS